MHGGECQCFQGEETFVTHTIGEVRHADHVVLQVQVRGWVHHQGSQVEDSEQNEG